MAIQKAVTKVTNTSFMIKMKIVPLYPLVFKPFYEQSAFLKLPISPSRKDLGPHWITSPPARQQGLQQTAWPKCNWSPT